LKRRVPLKHGTCLSSRDDFHLELISKASFKEEKKKKKHYLTKMARELVTISKFEIES
jgi:hypothetical protein